MNWSENTPKACQEHLLHILETLYNNKNVEDNKGSMIFRKIWNIRKCDQYHDLHSMRVQLRDKLITSDTFSTKSLSRIRSYDNKAQDDITALSVIYNNKQYIISCLEKGLSWKNYFIWKTSISQNTIIYPSLFGAGLFIGTFNPYSIHISKSY